MGAVEHLKTLCCLGLKPESAMIAVTPLLHEIIPHGETRISLLGSDASMGSGYSEHPGTAPLLRERLWRFMDDPSSPWSLWTPAVRAVGIGWTLPWQGRKWLDWILDAMIGDGGKSIGFVALTRPRSARPFAVDDVQRLDHLRPWLAHAFRRPASGGANQEDETLISTAGPTFLSGQLIVTPDARPVHQTPGLEFLLGILAGDLGITRATCLPARA